MYIFIYIYICLYAKCCFSPLLAIDPHLGAIVDDELHRSRLREDLRLTFSFLKAPEHTFLN